jgi:hypothetical protein
MRHIRSLDRRARERRTHIQGLVAKYAPEKAAERLKMKMDVLEVMRRRWAARRG